MAECHICNKKPGFFGGVKKCRECKRLVCDECAIRKSDGYYCPRCDRKL